MWTEFISEYGMFLAKLGTVVVFILFIISIAFYLYMRAKSGTEEHLEVRNINRKYEQLQLMLNSSMMPRQQFKRHR